MKKNRAKKILSILLSLALLMSYLPAAAGASGQTGDNRTADPSTMDDWKRFFLGETITTENAGGVWTDKSVFTDASAFAGTGINQDRQDGFLVALSAIASNMTVTGLSNVPTDTMMVLDLSSSMYNGFSRNPETVRAMLDSVNSTIDKLQKLNENNRVGVVVYYGGQNRIQSDASNSMVLLPLDRYSASGTYLKANVTGGRLISVAVASGVKNSAGAAVAQKKRTVTDVAGTYAQLGILDAMEQLLKADTKVPATAGYQPGTERVPVMIFMSDGEPTAATHRYTQKTTAGMGNNTVSIRNPNETDFVTQLTAAYAKEMIDAHYVENKPLFYTLSLGSSVSLAVMEPGSHTTAAIDGYWDQLLAKGSVKISVKNSPDGWSAPTVAKTYTVSATTVNGQVFPSDKDQRGYVDKAFTAANAGGLTDAFDNIVNQISIVSKYAPTLVSGSADLSGYISFVDKIGQYMNVTDIKGILIDNTLYSGAELARNFVEGGGELGTYDAPLPLGDEMVWAVQARMGLESADAARTLIGLAYEYGQLRYTGPTDYSNYIGWYANEAGEFLGFWHEGITTMPDATGDVSADPAYIIKSYGYLGAVDESHGVAESDMMYATVQVRRSIATGEESVAFAVPAALIPIMTYEVALDKNGGVSGLEISGAEHPIRLVYEVALEDGIDGFNLRETVSAEYLAANTDEEGYVSFYTNRYEADNTTGYGKVNTYSYFNPSRQNDKYYYISDAPVYTDTEGTLYMGDTQPSGIFYRSYTVYEKSGTALNARTVYRRLSDAALATAKQARDGHWYIGAGNVHVNLDDYTVSKTENTTGTLPDANIPFVDAHDHSVGDLGYRFIVGATLGNNGRLRLAPQTGIALRKTMAEDAAVPTGAFRFRITNVDDPSEDGEYPARVRHADGSQSDTTVGFRSGEAVVALNAGETLFIGGMTPGTTYKVEEIPTVDYVPDVNAYVVTLEANTLIQVGFVNSDRGTGNLTISKKVVHPLGSDYKIPEDKIFTVDVTLTGVGTANGVFPAVHTAGNLQSVTADDTGRFTVTLKHDEQIEIFGLPAGTVAAVTERDPGTGFTAAYWEDGQAGDGVVTVSRDVTASVLVTNTYEPGGVRPVNVALNGKKVFTTPNGSWNGAEFQIQLQKWAADGWNTIATATVNEENPAFSFSRVMEEEKFTAPGTYYYQVLETLGGQTLNGITYDGTLHTFGVTVTDQDMDGKLEIQKVTSFHTGREFEQDETGQWQIQVEFRNEYRATGCSVVLDVQKALTNLSGSPLVSLAGFRFGLYDGETLVEVSELTDGVGEARFLLHYEPEDVGRHTYTLKEILPQAPVRGMTYDDTCYTVVVTVTDNGDGTTSAAIVSIDGKTDFDTPVFTNVYDPEEVELPLDFVKKQLTGREMAAGEFTFVLRGIDNGILRTGSNDAEGNVIFDDKLVFDRVGTWDFELAETGTDGRGITMDKTVYRITVTVTDEQGRLTARHQVMNVVGSQVVFVNTYKAKETTYTVGGTKLLTGRVLLNDEFTFLMAEADANGTTEPAARSWEAKNFTDGSFRFDPITFHKAGIYSYVVWEKPVGSADYGITYDTARYTVTVTVEDDGAGQLAVTDVDITLIGQGAADRIRFTNRYVPEPTSARIPGSKILTGKVLNGGDFSFELYEAGDGWTAGRLLETVKNGADGSFAFTQLDYDAPGHYDYLVKETGGGQTVDGVTYDDTVYRVAVEVWDDLRGKLHATVEIYDEEGLPRESVVFQNTYNVTGEAIVELTGTKTLNGKALADGDFGFQLFRADESFTVSGEAIQTAVNVDGKFTLTLGYGSGDVGSTYYYVVRERFAGQTLEGVTYSGTEYWVAVTVADDGTGGIQTDVTVRNGGTEVTSLDFVNDYRADPVTLELAGTKALTGRALKDGEFTFELWQTNDSWFEIGQPLQVTNGADGSFRFTPITFTEPGTRYYLIRETGGGQTVDGVTYDDTVYCVIVEVTDDQKGKLSCTLDIYTSQGEPRQQIRFENTFTPDPEDVPLEITVKKTVKNLGIGTIGPQGFRFLLENVTLGGTQTAETDAEGEAVFHLNFTHEDIGKTYTYKLSEIDDGRANVTYSNAVYNITVTVGKNSENKLTATITNNGAEAAEAVAAFENTYDDRTDIPETGDISLIAWLTMLIISSGGIVSLLAWGTKEKKKET